VPRTSFSIHTVDPEDDAGARAARRHQRGRPLEAPAPARAAGVVSSRREGYYVVYSVATDRIEPLSEALLRFLG